MPFTGTYLHRNLQILYYFIVSLCEGFDGQNIGYIQVRSRASPHFKVAAILILLCNFSRIHSSILRFHIISGKLGPNIVGLPKIADP
jgi:hypothetical protein